MARHVSPPKNQLDKLRQPLTEGEQRVFALFDRHLPPAWEIYVQPHLNGLKPDFVLLNPEVGIAVFEIKDWDLNAMEYWIEPRKNQSPRLMARRDGEAFSRQSDNPIDKIHLYKSEIEELYCPQLYKRAGYVVITAGVIFPVADEEQVRFLFQKSREYYRMLDHEQYYPLVGGQSIQAGNLRNVFPEATRTSSMFMNPDLAQDLRGWLVEPDAPASQRRPLSLDSRQKDIVTAINPPKYRRIKGPAGSGKSLVVAARAAHLAAEGKNVLVITFNITLLHYLRDLAVRWPYPGGSRNENITWLNFHQWCKRVCLETGNEEAYKKMWREKFKGEIEEGPPLNTREILKDRLPNLVRSILQTKTRSQTTLYDAILVDEGQDIHLSWWRALQGALKEEGEMLLVADASQDNYGVAKSWPSGSWTDNPMEGAGFRGPWVQFKKSYRLPINFTPYARDFANRYLPKSLRDLPEESQLELSLVSCRMKWTQTQVDRMVDLCLEQLLSLVSENESGELSMSDVTFLVDTQRLGLSIVRQLESLGVRVVHTFSEDSRKSRRLKMGFFKGDARVKGTTIHSFKGWEARAIVLCIESASNPNLMALIYSGLTRVKSHPKGSFLSVVCAAPNLERYGRTWPEFTKILGSS